MVFALLSLGSFLLMAKDYNARDFGAVGNGVTMDTRSIQYAIDYICENGGGRLVLSDGTFLSGSIWLKDNVTLHVERGAVLQGSYRYWDYKVDPAINWMALVFAVDAGNIGISGPGTIRGGGMRVGEDSTKYWHYGQIIDDHLPHCDFLNERMRPCNVYFLRCDNVTIKDITFTEPTCWNQTYDLCTNMLFENMIVDANVFSNNDGIDLVDCQNVVMRKCFINSEDDAFCLKSHHVYSCCRNILIEDCRARSSASAVKFGTASFGGFKDITIRNMYVYDTYRSALTIASVDGAQIENILVDGLISINTGNPIFFRFGNRNAIADPNTDSQYIHSRPYIKGITVRNMYAEVPFSKADKGYPFEGPHQEMPRNVCPSSILGIPGLRIEDVSFENIEIVYPGYADKEFACRGYSPAELEAIPEKETVYPEFCNWQEMPAWAFYIRHADNVSFTNVKFRLDGPDYRPAIVTDDVKGFKTKRIEIVGNAEGIPEIVRYKTSRK